MLDLVILAVLCIGAVRGYMTGLVRQVASLIGFVVSFIVAVQLMGGIGHIAEISLGISPRVAPLVGFILSFMALQVAIFAGVRMIESLVGALKVSFLNRLAGGALGALKGALALGVVFLVLAYAGVPGEASRNDSVLYAPVAGVVPVVWNYAAEHLPRIRTLSEQFGAHIESHLPGSDESLPPVQE